MNSSKKATTFVQPKITTKQLTITAGLVAINLVLNQFTLAFGPLLEVGFAFLPIAVLGYLYGPINAGLASVVADTLGFLLRPAGVFFPGFTVSALLMGIIYGIFFHKKEITLGRVALAVLATSILLSLILTPIWLHIMYGSAFFAVPRIISTVLLYPIEVGLLFALLKSLRPVKSSLV